MKYRLAKVLDAKTYSADQTEVITLNLTQPISALVIEAKSLNNGATPTAHPAKSISKIELIDGSRVLHSLSGMQAQARSFYALGKSPENVTNYENDVYGTTPIVIPFGRFIGDPDYALDPVRFSQLQLRVTIDIGAGGSAADAVVLDIDAMVFDQKAISPKGFLLAKVHFDYALVSSAIEEVDLPTDRTLRSIYLSSPFTNKFPYEQVAAFKLSENNDQRIPFDQRMSHFIKLLGSMYGKVIEHIAGTVDTTGVALPCMPSYEVQAGGMGEGGTALYFSKTGGAGGTVTIKGNAGGLFSGIVEGLCPHGVIAIPFGDPMDSSDWYEMQGINALKLKLTAGSSVGSSSTCAVITEQIEPY